MKRVLDRVLILGVVLVLLSGTLFAQQREGSQFDAYAAWSVSSYSAKAAFINGIMVGSYYVAITYMMENPGKGLPPIDHLVPHGISVGEMIELIDAVYAYPANRQIAMVAIVCNWRKYAERYW